MDMQWLFFEPIPTVELCSFRYLLNWPIQQLVSLHWLVQWCNLYLEYLQYWFKLLSHLFVSLKICSLLSKFQKQFQQNYYCSWCFSRNPLRHFYLCPWSFSSFPVNKTVLSFPLHFYLIPLTPTLLSSFSPWTNSAYEQEDILLLHPSAPLWSNYHLDLSLIWRGVFCLRIHTFPWMLIGRAARRSLITYLNYNINVAHNSLKPMEKTNRQH